MITGFPARLRAGLPKRWFPDVAPNLDGLLASFGSSWDLIYQQLGIVQSQMRLVTVNGLFLDLAARDYTGFKFLRRAGESDLLFRSRLLPIFRDKVTRAALVTRLQILTGNTPRIIEPLRPADVGGYGIACGYGVAAGGAYGSTVLPAQVFVQIARPLGLGIPYLSGYGVPAGGYGVGYEAYARASDALPHVTDQDIYDAITDVLPSGATAWVALTAAS